MFEFLAKLSFNRAVNIGYIIFGNLLAPYWFLFQFAADIYKSNNVAQLLILSLAIGVPICLINFVFLLSSPKKIDTENKAEVQDKVDRIFSLLGVSSILIGIAFYLPCIVKFFESSLNQAEAISLVIIMNAGFIIKDIWDWIDYNREKRKEVKKNIKDSK